MKKVREKQRTMAGKSKRKTLSTKTRLRLIMLVILLAAAGFCAFLHFTGLYSFDRLKQDAGIEDKPAQDIRTQVHFVDVGQGDATLVISEGEAMLIDSGESDSDGKLIEYMKAQGVTKLKYVIVTHPHSDHMGEMSWVLKSFKTEKFIMPKVPDELVPTSSCYEKLLREIKTQGLKITKSSDCEFTLGSCKVQLFTPKKEYDNLNDYSTLVKITDGDNSFLVTGDCETDEEEDILSQGFDLSAKVLKVAHHGSSTSSSAEFLDKALPRYAVISCGEDNKYGHPHKETQTRLQKYASYTYQTSKDGTVTFLSDGEGLTVRTQKGDKQ